MGTELGHKTVLVTRPLEQAESLLALLKATGACAIHFPLIATHPPRHPETVEATLNNLAAFDLAIFVSPGAIQHTAPYLKALLPLPKHLKIAAMGESSRRQLATLGLEQVIVPTSHFESEGLLEALAHWEWAGKQVVIFRGDTGRPLLGDRLTAWGAQVSYVACYERIYAQALTEEVLQLCRTQALDAILLSSSGAVRHLFDIIPQALRQPFKHIPVFTAHPNIAEAARQIGCTQVMLTDVGDRGIVQGLIKWFQPT